VAKIDQCYWEFTSKNLLVGWLSLNLGYISRELSQTNTAHIQ